MKEMGIKKETDEILVKAKEESKKIEEYKQKLRQSAMGGVITNSLVNKATSLKKSVGSSQNENNPNSKDDLNQIAQKVGSDANE